MTILDGLVALMFVIALSSVPQRASADDSAVITRLSKYSTPDTIERFEVAVKAKGPPRSRAASTRPCQGCTTAFETFSWPGIEKPGVKIMPVFALGRRRRVTVTAEHGRRRPSVGSRP